MEDKKLACAITMVRDDFFFLERWVRYYAALFGRDALYIFAHGGDPRISEIAQGCNVITLPDVFDEGFDAVRWRLLQNLGNGLRGYYEFIILGDVDEFVLIDPKSGIDLREFLARRRGRMTLTPIGLEMVHVPERETGALDGAMLGARRYLRFTSAYSKPCIFNRPTDLSRGGHYAKDPELRQFRSLFLFHMRYVDEGLYRDTLQRRQAQVAQTATGVPQRGGVSWNWVAGSGREDAFDEAANLPLQPGFDPAPRLVGMQDSWGERENGLYGGARDIGQELFELPERFFGLI